MSGNLYSIEAIENQKHNFYFEYMDLPTSSCRAQPDAEAEPRSPDVDERTSRWSKNIENKNEHNGKETGRPDTGTPEPVRPVSAGLQRQSEGASVVERDRGGHGEAGGRGARQVEKSAR